MKFEQVSCIIFDFDGVILDSMKIRDQGFRHIFKEFEPADVDKLIVYHTINAGLSRFVKIRYFYKHVLNQEIDEAKVQQYADQFSSYVKEELIDPGYVIKETLDFIKINASQYKYYIASGSEESELKYLCDQHQLSDYFTNICGSPTPKSELVKQIIADSNIDTERIILIGDSINDYDAAVDNHIKFYGYNNENLKKVTSNYIESFSSI